MIRSRCLILCAALSLIAGPSVAVEQRGKGPDSVVVAAIDALLTDPGLKGGFQGIVVQSLKTGDVWYERNADLFFMPASNQKLITSAAVLGSLGPEWTFTTTLLRNGNLDDDGTFHGSLYLKGSGDPLLESKQLDLFAESVKAVGIRKVDGKVIGDDTRFDGRRLGLGWEWDDLPFYYAPEVSGLNLNKNLVTVTVEPGRKPGDPLRTSVTPLDRWATLTVRGSTDEPGRPPSITVTRALGTNEITVSGVLPAETMPRNRRSVGVTVANPSRYATAYLVSRLKALGIEVTRGEDSGVAPTTGTVEVARHTSEPLSEILKKMNKPSDNLIAECLLKALGAEKAKDSVGSWQSGAAAVKQWLKEAGIDPAGFSIEDGSGLSRHNFVTPRAFAAMLKSMSGHAYAKVFRDSLPVPGVDGTLRNRPIGPNAGKTCRAKTGSISNASTLSGYVETKSGEPLLFVIFMNNHQTPAAASRAVQDKIVEYLASRE